jgi:hypothetical protein
MMRRVTRDGITAALDLVEAWEARWGERPATPPVDPDRWAAAWEDFERRMGGNFPFFHPRYAGQMLKPPHPAAAAAYVAAMLVNPNNHALDGGPVTSEMEKEVVAELAAMLGLQEPSLGHLTSSGTIANLEALWVARELHPDRGIAYGANAHYTHARMCQVLRMPAMAVPATPTGQIDLDALDEACATGVVGTVVLTGGTTGLGAVDRIDEALALRERHGVRIHVDAAYGGFFTLLDDAPAGLRAIGGADSVVIDPHKHGLQPYGCGAVLFADPGVGRLYAHDSPYTYFTSDSLHLGEISLECSRAGAAAAALWMTLRTVPLKPVVTAARNAAKAFAARRPPPRGLERAPPAPAARAGHRHLPAERGQPHRDRRAERPDAARRHGRPPRPGLPQHAPARRGRPRRPASGPHHRRVVGAHPAQRAHEARARERRAVAGRPDRGARASHSRRCSYTAG